MKKLFIVLFAVVAFGFASNAQNAIGIRFGGGNGYGAELSYQKDLSANRLELDLGISKNADNYFHLAAVYQWKGILTGNLGWFLGVGANVGYCKNHGLGLAAVGQLGLEYNFPDIPLQVSLDARPSYEFLLPDNRGYHGFGWGACLGVRYRF